MMQSLIHAANEGKQVVALVELKARFDEERNIEWAQRLEDAGVHVVYGVAGLKTHTKISLVVRDEGETIRRYGHIATGNYNETTARLYEDLGLFTSDAEIGADLSDLFNFLTGYSRQRSYRKLAVSPEGIRRRLVELIEHEASMPDGSITMKMNSLADPGMIDALYAASEAGTRIDLIVRGICCLIPEVPGMSSNIRVRSIVGPVSGAFADLPVRVEGADPHLSDRLRRPDASQPRPPGRGTGTGRGPRPPVPPRRDHRRADGRRRAGLGAQGRRPVAPGADRERSQRPRHPPGPGHGPGARAHI